MHYNFVPIRVDIANVNNHLAEDKALDINV